jgi:fructoselysine-6-P-deglycase FrlB-like protein
MGQKVTEVESPNRVGEAQAVEGALRSQKKIWRSVVSEILNQSYERMLPPGLPRRILLFGEGSSYFAAKLTAFSLIRENLKTQRLPQIAMVACKSTQVEHELIPERGDWVFVFSHRGKTKTTLRAAEFCARLGAFVVWVCAKGVELPSSGRFLLPTSPLEKCEPHTMGLTSAICAVTTLLSGSQMGEHWISLSCDPDPELSFLQEKAGVGPRILLGEWEGEWIAREIRLKLIEMAGVFPLVFGSEEFFHGPHSKLDLEPRIWYLAHPRDERRTEIQASYVSEWNPSLSIGWVSALVEMQWMSLGVALNSKRDPEGFLVS